MVADIDRAGNAIAFVCVRWQQDCIPVDLERRLGDHKLWYRPTRVAVKDELLRFSLDSIVNDILMIDSCGTAILFDVPGVLWCVALHLDIAIGLMLSGKLLSMRLQPAQDGDDEAGESDQCSKTSVDYGKVAGVVVVNNDWIHVRISDCQLHGHVWSGKSSKRSEVLKCFASQVIETKWAERDPTTNLYVLVQKMVGSAKSRYEDRYIRNRQQHRASDEKHRVFLSDILRTAIGYVSCV